jgi:HAD superfamily hydrolase (TIGR01509 family)
MPRRMPAAVIFDNDGLTLDTEHTWTRAESALYARYGTEFTLDHKREMLGTSGPTSARAMERHLDQPGRGPELNAELRELVHAELDGAGVQPMPGVLDLLDALHGHGVPVGLATNSGRAFATRALRSAGVLDRFAAVVSGHDVAHPKPAPDVYLEAAAQLGADPAACVALEDSETGVAAAKAAGMTVIGVPSFPGIALDAADLVVASLEDPRVRELLGLPAAGGPARTLDP